MKEKMVKRLFLIFVIIIIVIAIIVVKKQGGNDNHQIEQKSEEKSFLTELRIGISGLDTFDPILSTNKNVQDVCKLIYEPLITVDENYKIKGVLATEWAKTSERTYIVKLKQGVKWHDGKEFTSKDVEFTINKIKQADSSVYKSNVDNIAKVVIIDNYTIRLELNDEKLFFEYELIFPIEEDSNNSILQGTGFYKIYKMEQNKIELMRNQYKENIENVQSKSIIITNYETMGELYNDFKIGNVDIINTSNINYYNYIGTLGYSYKNFYGRNFEFLSLNTRNSALYNIEVRKAISYAIDKNLIVSTIYDNKYFVADYILDYGSWLYSDENTSSGYNPEQSKKILEDNDWKYENNIWQKEIDDKKVQLKFNLIVKSDDDLRINVAQSIKEQLENIGIHINIIEVASVVANIESKNYDMALVEMSMSVSPNLEIFFGENNLANYENQESITIIEELKNINDEKLLKEKYNRLLEVYKNDIPYISLYFDSNTLIYNSKLTGTITPNWYNLYYNIENWRIET